MRLDFDLTTDLMPDQVYAYFVSPHDWPRLFTAFGATSEMGGGWVRVPIVRSPYALQARISEAVPGDRVAWDLRGFWKGCGEVRFRDLQDGTHITGFEEVKPWLDRSAVFRNWAEPRFAAVWESGWRRIRREPA